MLSFQDEEHSFLFFSQGVTLSGFYLGLGYVRLSVFESKEVQVNLLIVQVCYFAVIGLFKSSKV